MKNEDRPEKREKIINRIEGDPKIVTGNKPEPTTPPHNENQESQPKVVRKPTLAYPGSVRHLGTDGGHPQETFGWHPTDTLDLKKFKESVTNYGMQSPFVKQILNSWAI